MSGIKQKKKRKKIKWNLFERPLKDKRITVILIENKSLGKMFISPDKKFTSTTLNPNSTFIFDVEEHLNFSSIYLFYRYTGFVGRNRTPNIKYLYERME